jgi:hypothetical protein
MSGIVKMSRFENWGWKITKKTFNGTKKKLKCGFYKNWCRASVGCIQKEFVNMDRCFWEERLLGIFIYKNDQLLNHHSVIFMVGLYLDALKSDGWCVQRTET